MSGPVEPDLARLAGLHGVATDYEDQQHRLVRVGRDSVVATLAALGVDASTPAALAAALEDARLAPYRRLLPPTVVVRQGVGAAVELHPVDDRAPRVRLVLESGDEGAGLTWRTAYVAPVEVDGRAVGTRTLVLPPDLPLGYHRLEASAGDQAATATVIVAPDRLQLPPRLTRAWGWMLQLYAVRSARSWGIGDFADLADLVRWSAADGAGFLLCNPLHAVSPVPPLQPSPYYPASRRFANPLYLRVEDTARYAAAPAGVRRRIDVLAARQQARNQGDRLDRDTCWAAKREALQLLWDQAPEPPGALEEFRQREGSDLEAFATWCALAEQHGSQWQQWPEELRYPDAPAVILARGRLRDRIDFHAWLQLLCEQQLTAAEDAAERSGMPVGVVHDLPVGVDPGGADAWALQDLLAVTTTVGAPPDAFNQQGQGWGLPPWRPDRLADVGYRPYRDLLRAVLRHAGGLRVDHILGLFRLWWVPAGRSPAEGTYVRYDADALLGVLTLEAHRAGALVIGEDLGTVERRVQRELADRGILGSAVLWFERSVDPDTGEEGGRRPLEEWRELALASITTHDLPTAAGFLVGEHVRVRDELHQLARPVEEERQSAAVELAELCELLRANGLVGADPTRDELLLAMHAALTRTPCRLVAVAPGDAVGDLRQPNLPGTVDEYPNWRLPIADAEGRPLTVEDLRADPGVRRVVALMQEHL